MPDLRTMLNARLSMKGWGMVDDGRRVEDDEWGMVDDEG
jgi:hypothetical protein